MPRVSSVAALAANIRYEDEVSTPFVESWGVQVYVKATLDEGSVGWGEVLVYGSSMADAYLGALEDVIIPASVGEQVEDVSSVRSILSRIERLTFTAGLCGVVSGAIGGLEMSLMDALARLKGVPLWRLIGERRSDRVSVYASFPRYSRPQDAVRVAQRSVERGFTMIKLHQPPGEALDFVKAVREALGYDVKVAVDLNGGLPLDKAVEFVNSASRYELEWVEEPVWPVDDHRALAQLASRSPVPVAAGENEYSVRGLLDLARSGVSVVQPDISKLGGVLRMLDAVDALEREGVTIAPHLRPHRSFLAHAFVVHIASMRPSVGPVEWPSAQLATDALEAPELPVSSGLLDASGLVSSRGVGVSVREDVVSSRYRYVKGFRPLVFH